MKIIVAGTRKIKFNPLVTVSDAILKGCDHFGYCPTEIEEVVHGNSGDVDLAAKKWARNNHFKERKFPADWDTYGKAAGPYRNRQMALYVGQHGLLIAVWEGRSKGTFSMMTEAFNVGMNVYVHMVT